MALLTGGSGNDKLIGTSLIDTLSGLAGNDILFGFGGNDLLDGGAGNDLMRGGAGDDTYVVDSAGDVVDEQGALGTNDLVKGTVSVNLNTLGGGLIEHATLLGTTNRSAVGNAQANKLVGNLGNNVLSGGGENDTLNGGAGNDTMRGGAGNDTYVIDSMGDRIDEEGNGDSDDVVRTMVSVNLTTLAGGAIEHAVLLGSSALNASGSSLDNRLTGNNGANRLDGDRGADTMIGGVGNDIYIVDDAGDQVIEQTLGGMDLVKAGMSFSLLSMPYVEHLTLTGTGDFDATGNAANNILTGNSGANRLNGGRGADTMIGGYNDDYYVVNSVGDRVKETVPNRVGGGHDTVQSSVSFSLHEHGNVEDLYLVGTRDIDGTGEAAAESGRSGQEPIVVVWRSSGIVAGYEVESYRRVDRAATLGTAEECFTFMHHLDSSAANRPRRIAGYYCEAGTGPIESSKMKFVLDSLIYRPELAN